jgi:hypothetical protein
MHLVWNALDGEGPLVLVGVQAPVAREVVGIRRHEPAVVSDSGGIELGRSGDGNGPDGRINSQHGVIIPVEDNKTPPETFAVTLVWRY